MSFKLAKPIPGFPLYKVTRDGTVWSVHTSPTRELTPWTGPRGYQSVRLYRDTESYFKLVHRLVLMAWDRVPRPGEQCRHLNGDPSDNRLSNLAWGTAQENQDDRARHGTKCIGEAHPMAQLSAEEVLAIRRRYRDEDVSQQELGASYGVGRSMIGRVVRGENWEHVGGPILGQDHSVHGSRTLAKINPDLVEEIRTRYRDENVSQTQLAKEYGLTDRSSVSHIVRGVSWKHAPGPVKGQDY